MGGKEEITYRLNKKKKKDKNIEINGIKYKIKDLIQSDVVEVLGNFGGFSAIKKDGTIITWGNRKYGGDLYYPKKNPEIAATDWKNIFVLNKNMENNNDKISVEIEKDGTKKVSETTIKKD